MWCSKCSSDKCSCPTACGSAYYNQADICEEDNCQKIYVNGFYFAICTESSWNIPVCGQTAILSVPGVQRVSIGSYIWHTAYGYYQIVSIDVAKGQIGIVNNCTIGNAPPGTQIPACTCFTITTNPIDVPGASFLFPYLALDFTAPADGNCVDITVTNINGLASGDIISIGTGLYTIDSFGSDTVVRICNTGEGILPGTPVVAKDSGGNFVYPINVVSNCCGALIPRLDALDVDIINLLGSGGVWGSTSAGTANAQTIAVNPDLVQIDGTVLRFIAGFTTTSTTPTLNVNGDGARTILDKAGRGLFAGDITAGDLVVIVAYNSNYRLMSSTGARMLLRNTTTTSVSNSAVLTTLSTTVIPAGFLSTGKQIRIKMLGVVSNGSGGGQTVAIPITYGGTIVATGVLFIPNGDVDNFSIEAVITASAINAQTGFATSILGQVLGGSDVAMVKDTTTIDGAINQNLVIAVQLSAADPTLIFSVNSQFIEYI